MGSSAQQQQQQSLLQQQQKQLKQQSLDSGSNGSGSIGSSSGYAARSAALTTPVTATGTGTSHLLATVSHGDNGVKTTIAPTTRFWKKLLPRVQFEPMFAGIAGGVTSTLILHPLDLLRIRLSVNDGQLKTRPHYLGIRNACTRIVNEEGVKGLYRGVFSNCIGNGTSWGLYFLFYHSIKNYMLNSQRTAEANHVSQHNTAEPQKDVDHLGPAKHMLAAAEAGCITQVITNPLSMVKTRLCLQYTDQYMNVPATKRYNGMVDAFQKVVKYEGFTGLYKGLLPGVFNVAHGSIQFMVYEEMKEEYSIRVNRHRLTTWEYLIFAAISKLIAAAFTYPQQLIRARLQDQHRQYTGFLEVVRRTYRAEGLRGFYKGFGAYSIHVTPNICIVFLIYENMYPSED
ncbi:mitochondrial folate transporter/carrier-like [Tropilaelaps mercedesae]|uniref:Mitochondrial folate transporter/carrier-like n=1 Tax=Tropilaelaps mercedesae TaxID=418985 RepID=A0A1V9XLI8_9ACAR|nr:mitochondrial folate transporter/carrier-like [Tropilaelaps mercedesae]